MLNNVIAEFRKLGLRGKTLFILSYLLLFLRMFAYITVTIVLLYLAFKGKLK